MELSHRDQIESRAAAGLLSADTHWLFAVALLSAVSGSTSRLPLFNYDSRGRWWRVPKRSSWKVSFFVVYSLFSHPLHPHARRPICVLSTEEFSSRTFARPWAQGHHGTLKWSFSLKCSNKLSLYSSRSSFFPWQVEKMFKLFWKKTSVIFEKGQKQDSKQQKKCNKELHLAWLHGLTAVGVMHVEKCIDLFSMDPCQRWMRHNGDKSMQRVI